MKEFLLVRDIQTLPQEIKRAGPAMVRLLVKHLVDGKLLVGKWRKLL